jgi:hypothetical protein
METRKDRKIVKTVKKTEPPSTVSVKKRPASAFWKGKTFEELTKEQGVKPIKDVSQLKGYWPEGADFDSFYEAAVGSRKHAESD